MENFKLIRFQADFFSDYPNAIEFKICLKTTKGEKKFRPLTKTAQKVRNKRSNLGFLQYWQSTNNIEIVSLNIWQQWRIQGDVLPPDCQILNLIFNAVFMADFSKIFNIFYRITHGIVQF